MPTASPVMCAESRNFTTSAADPRQRGARLCAAASIVSPRNSVPYAAASATKGVSHDCSKPRNEWPSILSTVIAKAKRDSPPSRFSEYHRSAIGADAGFGNLETRRKAWTSEDIVFSSAIQHRAGGEDLLAENEAVPTIDGKPYCALVRAGRVAPS